MHFLSPSWPLKGSQLSWRELPYSEAHVTGCCKYDFLPRALWMSLHTDPSLSSLDSGGLAIFDCGPMKEPNAEDTDFWPRNDKEICSFSHSVPGSFVTQQALTHMLASIRCKLSEMKYSCSENGITVKWTNLSFYLATQEEAGLVLGVGKPWS